MATLGGSCRSGQVQEKADVPAAVVMRNREMLPLRDSLLDATPSFPQIHVGDTCSQP